MLSGIVGFLPADGISISVGCLQLIGGVGATAVNQRPVKSTAGCRFPQPASKLGIAEQTGDHRNIGVMAFGYFPRHQQTEYEVDGFSIAGVEVYGLRQLDHCSNAPVDTFDTTMREGDARIQARAAETLSLDETLENVVCGYIGLRPNQEFTQDFQTVFLAACVRIAEYSVRINDFFDQHSFLLFLG
jgi:hypothetical protein